MKPFQFSQPGTLDDALENRREEAMWLAGGTTLVDLMKLNVLTPRELVSIKPLLDSSIQKRDSQLYIGAGCTMAQVASDPLVSQHLPVVKHSLLLAASPQIRNMATLGGNVLQRTRSPYFRHIDFPDSPPSDTRQTLNNAPRSAISRPWRSWDITAACWVPTRAILQCRWWRWAVNCI